MQPIVYRLFGGVGHTTDYLSFHSIHWVQTARMRYLTRCVLSNQTWRQWPFDTFDVLYVSSSSFSILSLQDYVQ